MKKIFFLLLFFFSPVSFADTYPGVSAYLITSSPCGGVNSSSSSISAACNTLVGYLSCLSATATSVLSTDGLLCRIQEPGVSGHLYQNKIPTLSIICPGGGVVSGTSCINAPACVLPQVRNTITAICQTPPTCKIAETYNNATNLCVAPVCTSPQINDAITGACVSPVTVCSSTQNPIKNNCYYPKNVSPLNCLNGTVAYPPAVCPSAAPWQDTFPNPVKPMCSPLQADHSQCTPLLFQRLNDWASGHAIQYALAALLIGNPVITTATGLITGASTLLADFPTVWRNSAGEIVDTVVRAEVPSSAYGQAVSEWVKNNPTDPYVAGLPDAINNATTGAPDIVRDPTTGDLRSSDSTTPFSANQIADMIKEISPTYPIPQAEISPYLHPENIPWMTATKDALQFDFQHLDQPFYFPSLTTPPAPVSVRLPTVIRTPSPLSIPDPYIPYSPDAYPYPTEQDVQNRQPFISVGPQSPSIYSPAPAPSPAPGAPPPLPSKNPNPDGSVPLPLPAPAPDPNTPVDPKAPELPPEIPPIYPDTWEFFNFLPMANPFSFNVHDFFPDLPEPNCTYEIHRTFHVSFLGTKSFDLAPCIPLQPLRAVLAWVFSVLTIFTCFFVIFRSSV